MTWIFLLAMVVGGQGMVAPQSESPSGAARNAEVVFVCDHGAALSVISAAYFNQMAREQHLQLHAIARGITPQEDLSVRAREGLQADGIAVETTRPQALSPDEAAHAKRVIAFCPLSAKYSRKKNVEAWSDITWPGTGYQAARDAIRSRLAELIKELNSQQGKR